MMQPSNPTTASEVRIGLFLADDKGLDAEPRREDLPGQSRLILTPEPEEKKVVNHVGEEVSSMTWQKYLALRPTTCKPRLTSPEAVYGSGSPVADETDDYIAIRVRADTLEELDQATLEFVGETAELAELCYTNGYKVLYGENRKQLIDECGDILFTAAWALDAWSLNPLPPRDYSQRLDDEPLVDILARSVEHANPLLDMDDTELVRVTDDDPPAMIALTILQSGGMALAKNRGFVGTANQMIFHHASAINMLAGLTANAFKKLRYQRREQPIPTQLERICTALVSINILLIMANSSIEEAMIVNRAKLDKRFPGGYKPGQGGGIRTEG